MPQPWRGKLKNMSGSLNAFINVLKVIRDFQVMVMQSGRQLRLRQRVCPQILTLWKMLLVVSESCLLLLPISRMTCLMIQTRGQFEHYTRAAPCKCYTDIFDTNRALLLACLQSCSSCIYISTNWFTCHSAIWCENLRILTTHYNLQIPKLLQSMCTHT